MRDTRVWFGNTHRRSQARFHLPAVDFRLEGRALCGARIFHEVERRNRKLAPDAPKGTKENDRRLTFYFGAYERSDFLKRYPDRACVECERRNTRLGQPCWRD